MNFGKDAWLGGIAMAAAGALVWNRGIVSGGSRSATGTYAVAFRDAVSLLDCTIMTSMELGAFACQLYIELAADGLSCNVLAVGSNGAVLRDGGAWYLQVMRNNYR